MEIAHRLIRLLRARPLLQRFSKLPQHLVVSQPSQLREILYHSSNRRSSFITPVHIPLQPRAQTPARTQSLISSLASNSDAAVCATTAPSGSLNIRSVAACRINRLTICSVSGVCAAISANEICPPAGTRLAMSKRASAWRQAAWSLYFPRIVSLAHVFLR